MGLMLGAQGSHGGAPRIVRVVLADAQDVVRRGLRGVLAAVPGLWVVGEATTVNDARRWITTLRPDVIISDVAFTDGTVVDLCRHVRTVQPSVRVVVVTACADPDIVYQAVFAGVVAYLLVDVSPEAFVDAIARVVAGQSLLDPAVTGQLLERMRHPDAVPVLQLPPELTGLTAQERRILELIVDGLTNREIGEALRLSEQTVKNHVTGVLAKLGVTRRTQVVALGARLRRRAPGQWPLP